MQQSAICKLACKQDITAMKLMYPWPLNSRLKHMISSHALIHCNETCIVASKPAGARRLLATHAPLHAKAMVRPCT